MVPTIWFLFIALIPKCWAVGHERWKRVRIPSEYWQPIRSEEAPFHQCSSNCHLVEDCAGFIHDRASDHCVTGKLNVTGIKYIPHFYPNGTQVFLRGSCMNYTVKTVTRLHRLLGSGTQDPDDAIEDPDFSPALDIPVPYGQPDFALQMANGDVLSCGAGGSGGTPRDKHCRVWSFRTSSWTELPGGESANGHYRGMYAMLAGRVWLFCGVQAPGGGGTRNVDSYDLINYEWRQESVAASTVSTGIGSALGLEKIKKILLVGGRHTTTMSHPSHLNGRVHLFDPATGEYEELTHVTLQSKGIIFCAMDPSTDGEMAICAGGRTPPASDPKDNEHVYFFDVLAQRFLENEVAHNLPVKALVNFVTVDGILYAVTHGKLEENLDRVYKYHPDSNPQMWELLPHVRMGAGWTNSVFGYKMDYMELIA